MDGSSIREPAADNARLPTAGSSRPLRCRSTSSAGKQVNTSNPYPATTNNLSKQNHPPAESDQVNTCRRSSLAIRVGDILFCRSPHRHRAQPRSPPKHRPISSPSPISLPPLALSQRKAFNPPHPHAPAVLRGRSATFSSKALIFSALQPLFASYHLVLLQG